MVTIENGFPKNFYRPYLITNELREKVQDALAFLERRTKEDTEIAINILKSAAKL